MLDHEDIQALRRFMEAREQRDAAKAASDAAEKEYREMEAELFDRLTDPETGAIRRIPPVNIGDPWGRVGFSARETYYGRIVPGHEDEAIEYFTQRGMLKQVTQPKFAKKRLNEIARDCVEQNKPMPPGLDFYASRGITVTREKK